MERHVIPPEARARMLALLAMAWKEQMGYGAPRWYIVIKARGTQDDRE